jgi:hypothetical protein
MKAYDDVKLNTLHTPTIVFLIKYFSIQFTVKLHFSFVICLFIAKCKKKGVYDLESIVDIFIFS